MTAFADLHHQDLPLLLPNAWDVASAVLLADAGYPAVGTTSMGVANSLGVPDGLGASRDATVRLVEALAGLDVLVSADVEDGYDDDPDTVARFVADLPVAGINLEDSSPAGLVDPALVAAKVTAVKDRRPDVFINARVDTYWLRQEATEEATVARARTYLAAGADGVFVPGVGDPALLGRLAAAIDAPLNVLPVAGASLADLAAIGVRRVSTGSLPYRAALRAALVAVERTRDGEPLPDAIGYEELQEVLERRGGPPLQ